MSIHGLIDKNVQETDAQYRAVEGLVSIEDMESLFSVSDKMLRVIAYVFEKLEEVTPLMLQKLLYFIQGVYSALYGKPVFAEDCRAWIHGPVYPEVYDLLRDFKYNPIDDARFAFLEGKEDVLTDDEKKVKHHDLRQLSFDADFRSIWYPGEADDYYDSDFFYGNIKEVVKICLSIMIDYPRFKR